MLKTTALGLSGCRAIRVARHWAVFEGKIPRIPSFPPTAIHPGPMGGFQQARFPSESPARIHPRGRLLFSFRRHIFPAMAALAHPLPHPCGRGPLGYPLDCRRRNGHVSGLPDFVRPLRAGPSGHGGDGHPAGRLPDLARN